jgi:N-methylhydantoinase A/oxoprolinase/acetone carboxylase beta subunit
MTDAALVLGLLGANSLLGGGMTLSRPAAEAALGALASRLSMSVTELAAGVFKIMNANIAASIRLALVERGLDPRDFALIALGGAGPVHAAAVANEIGIPRVVIPPYPGITSALGAATTDLIHHYAAAVMETIESISPSRLELSFVSMEKRGQAALAAERVAIEDIELRRSCDMRYLGQYHETSIALTGQVTSSSLRKIAGAFHGRHRALYGFNQPDDPVMITNIRVQAIGAIHSERTPISGAGSKSTVGQESTRSREVCVEDSAGTPWPVLQRAELATEFHVEGPCIIEQTDTTTVVLSGQKVRRTGAGFLLIDEVTGNE